MGKKSRPGRSGQGENDQPCQDPHFPLACTLVSQITNCAEGLAARVWEEVGSRHCSVQHGKATVFALPKPLLSTISLALLTRTPRLHQACSLPSRRLPFHLISDSRSLSFLLCRPQASCFPNFGLILLSPPPISPEEYWDYRWAHATFFYVSLGVIGLMRRVVLAAEPSSHP